MKNPLLSSLVALAALAPLRAGRHRPRPRQTPLPILRKDFSPVGAGKLGIVTTYADVVEPWIKAVVTITLSKTVRVPRIRCCASFSAIRCPTSSTRRRGSARA